MLDAPAPSPVHNPFDAPYRPAPVPVSTGAPVRPAEHAGLLAIVALADLFLWNTAFGYGTALALLGAAGALALTSDKHVRSARLTAQAVLLVSVAARFAWQPSVSLGFLAFVLLAAFSFSLRTPHGFVPDELAVTALTPPLGVVQAVTMLRDAVGRLQSRRLLGVRWATVLIPLATVSVFGLVFTAANPVLGRALSKAIERFFALSAVPDPLHVAFLATVTALGAGLVRPLVQANVKAPDHFVEPTDAPVQDSTLATVRNTLLGLNALFLGFNALDLVCLYGGRIPAGIGYTQYAHEGTFWLTVALALSTVVLGVAFRGPMFFDPKARPVRTLAWIWSAQNAVLALGTFRRVWLYIDFSGLTTLRLVGIAGTALVVVGLGLVVLRVRDGRSFLWLVRRQLDALAVAVVLFSVLPTDAWVSRFNTARILRGERRPLLHLVEQSLTAESVDDLLPLLRHPDRRVREGVAARLLTLQGDLRAEHRRQRWTGRSYTQEHALRVLAARQGELNALFTEPGQTERASVNFRSMAWESNQY